LLRRNVGEDVVKKALGNHQLLCVIIRKDSMHMDVCQVYKQEVFPKALHTIFFPLLLNRVPVISIYGGGAFSLIASVS
jgi:hypothetical protein